MTPQRNWAELDIEKAAAELRWFASFHPASHNPNVRISTCAACRAFLKREVWP